MAPGVVEQDAADRWTVTGIAVVRRPGGQI
jgi:hypothetical protein